MMQPRLGAIPIVADNPLGLSWHDSAWIPMLNPSNIIDYFSQRSNPFFDKTCNNESIKMQRLNPEQINNMTGLEYMLLHVQEPILYVIRKQYRHSPTQATPLADYYIIAGVVYQAPDLASVLNSRLLTAVHHLQASFEETTSYSRYHPSKGYSWDFKPNKTGIDRGILGNIIATPTNAAAKEAQTAPKEEPSTLFQRQRVDMLLGELLRQFPLPTTQQPDSKPVVNGVTVKTEASETKAAEGGAAIKQEPGEAPAAPVANGVTSVVNGAPGAPQEPVKQESMKPPPEKKPRLN